MIRRDLAKLKLKSLTLALLWNAIQPITKIADMIKKQARKPTPDDSSSSS